MAYFFKIARLLKDEDWQPFHELLSRPGSTVDAAHTWTRRRGYDVCRTAIGNYMKSIRERSIYGLRIDLAAGSDAELRGKITKLIEQLQAGELAALAQFAAFLISGVARVQKISTSDHRSVKASQVIPAKPTLKLRRKQSSARKR